MAKRAFQYYLTLNWNFRKDIIASAENTHTLNMAYVRTVYLITFSCTDMDVWQRDSFADAVASCFNPCTATKVVQLACCMETHKDWGFHCHLYIPLNQCQCWLKVKNAIIVKENIHILLELLAKAKKDNKVRKAKALYISLQQKGTFFRLLKNNVVKYCVHP